MTYLACWMESMDAILRRIRETQLDAIRRAARLVAESLARQGAFVVMDTGHMLKHEALGRAGGLMAIAPFSYALNVENPIAVRAADSPRVDGGELERRVVAAALDSSKMRPGDVLVINSNSGRTSNVIEVALQCRERGIATVGISSREQMAQCPAAHASGKKLVDAVDVYIDNCGPHGDATVPVKDNEKICPASGIAAAYVFWALHAEAVEQLQAMGVNPTIYRSVHVSGFEYVERQREQFMERGV